MLSKKKKVKSFKWKQGNIEATGLWYGGKGGEWWVQLKRESSSIRWKYLTCVCTRWETVMPTCSVDFFLISMIVLFSHVNLFLLPVLSECVYVCVCMDCMYECVFYLFGYLLQIAFLTSLWVCALTRKPFFWKIYFWRCFILWNRHWSEAGSSFHWGTFHTPT